MPTRHGAAQRHDGPLLCRGGRVFDRFARVASSGLCAPKAARSARTTAVGISSSKVAVSVTVMTTRGPGGMNDPRRVAWVTGASRGVGRGVALALGAAGWTVYVTARSSTTSGRTGHLPGTVEECAAAVTARGGLGIGVECDHRDDAAVAGVAERIAASHGRLDLLVNNAWAGYERLNAGAGRSGTLRCGSSRSSCSTPCSTGACAPTTSRWRRVRRC